MVAAAAQVSVIGGGAAALCAALQARLCGADVTLYEAAPAAQRGGNTRHSRNLRLVHDAPSPLFPGVYQTEEFLNDLRRVTRGACDETLARLLIERSADIPGWMLARGVRFQTTGHPALPVSRRTAFFLGGGMGLLNHLYQLAGQMGIAVRLGCPLTDIRLDEAGRVNRLRFGDGQQIDDPQAVIIACGGGQANRAALAEHWGPAAHHLLVRGTAFADGAIQRQLQAQGVQPVGSPSTGHLVAVDARSPAYDGGIVTRVLSIPHGLVVNLQGDRFHDEGGDRGPTRYAVWGRLVAALPEGRAWVLLDQAGLDRAPVPLYPPLCADSWESLAQQTGLPPQAVAATVARYNAACGADGKTSGLVPAKSAQAVPLVGPPCYAVPVAPGITFPYDGLKVNTALQFVRTDGRDCPNLWGAGMILSANILGAGYIAGLALTISCVSGLIAGEHAARSGGGRAGAF